MTARTLPLRRLLIWIGLMAAGYVAAIVVYLQFFMLPTAAALRGDTERVLEAQGVANERIERLNRAIMGVEFALRGRPEALPVPADTVAMLEARVDTILRSMTGLDVTERLQGVAGSVRIRLATASGSETRAGERLMEAIAALEGGSRDRARELLIEADHYRETAEAELTGAETAAIDEVLRRERDLEEAAGGAVIVLVAWGLIGSGLVVGAFLILRVRLYRPLAAIESSLTRIAEGDLSTSVDIDRDDEMGRLGGMLNRLTSMLADRERQEDSRRRGVIERYSRILEESASELIALDASTFRVLDANRKAIVHLGYVEPELAKRTAFDLWDTDRGMLEETLRSVVAGEGEQRTFLTDQVREGGGRYPVEVTVFGAPAQDPPSIMAVIHDLTERRRLEDVHELLARFALEKGALLQAGDLDAAIREITETASGALDVSRASVWLCEDAGMRCIDVFDRSSREHSSGEVIEQGDYPEYFRALTEERTIDVVEAHTDPRTAGLSRSYLIPHGVGAMLDAPFRLGGALAGVLCGEHVGGRREWTPDERVLAASLADFVSQALETEERRKAEQALQESEQRYRTTFERAAVGLAEIDASGRFRHANPPLLRILGYTLDELRELNWRDITYPEDIAEGDRLVAEMALGTLESDQREKRYVCKDGTIAWVEVSSAPVRDENGIVTHFVGVVKDISEARDLQSQLAHAQRMDSIGRLAGGIAHDFNNLLTAILGHAEMGRATLTPEDPAYPDLREIEESALRATSLTRQLLTFARRQVVETRTVDLDELTHGAERLLRRLIGENIELVTALDSGGYMVQIDPGQFEQVIVNLAVNARDAMPEGGRLKISTRRRVVDLSASGEGVETECVELLVEDSGTGMPEEVRGRIFEPFFTTKGAGEGIGLGLATSYGIVGQAGGSISVRSTVGEGTTFTILLPIVPGSAPVGDRVESGATDTRGGETILVVEDEEAVRRLVVEVLRRQGYEVLQAGDGVEALEVLHGDADVLDLMVTDIVMPKMGGPEVAARVREMKPDIRVLFMSGYSAETDRHEALAEEGTAFLPKPFTPTELAAKVRALCDGLTA